MREKTVVRSSKPHTARAICLDGVYINQTELSHKTGLDQGTLSRILSGHRTPNMFHAQKITEAIGFSLDRFISAVLKRREELDQQRLEK